MAFQEKDRTFKKYLTPWKNGQTVVQFRRRAAILSTHGMPGLPSVSRRNLVGHGCNTTMLVAFRKLP